MLPFIAAFAASQGAYSLYQKYNEGAMPDPRLVPGNLREAKSHFQDGFQNAKNAFQSGKQAKENFSSISPTNGLTAAKSAAGYAIDAGSSLSAAFGDAKKGFHALGNAYSNVAPYAAGAAGVVALLSYSKSKKSKSKK